VCADVCGQLAAGEHRIFGVMLESNLVEGSQQIAPPASMTYGQSITDACLGWDDSKRALGELAAASAVRMARS
jgi:3-deoxy-7-phosphoheptulonate synthase